MNHHCRSAQVWHVFSRDFTVLPAHPHVHPQSEWAIPAFAFPAITGTHLPTRRDGRLSRPWYEVAQAEIRTCNLPIANPALYHTSTSAPWLWCYLACLLHLESEFLHCGCAERAAEAARAISESTWRRLGRSHAPAAGTRCKSSRHTRLCRKRNVFAVRGETSAADYFSDVSASDIFDIDRSSLLNDSDFSALTTVCSVTGRGSDL